MANLYDLNDGVRVGATFKVATVNTDPTTITLKVKDPDRTTTTYTYALAEITKSATGIYYKDITANRVGRWNYRWEGTGTVVATDEGTFIVELTDF